MEVISGDILDVTNGIIVHQVNCIGAMGAGLAKKIRNKYPQHYDDYMKMVKSRQNKAELLSKVVPTKINDSLYIMGVFAQINIASADRYGNNFTEYESYPEALDTIEWFRSKMERLDKKKTWNVYIPYGIGCGLAGGDLNKMTEIFHKWEKKYGNGEHIKIIKLGE